MKVVLLWVLFSLYDPVSLHPSKMSDLWLCLSPFHSPFLTWRDVQHIIVRTSRAGHLNANDWKTNAAGYKGESFLSSLLSQATYYLIFLFNTMLCTVWRPFSLSLTGPIFYFTRKTLKNDYCTKLSIKKCIGLTFLILFSPTSCIAARKLSKLVMFNFSFYA